MKDQIPTLSTFFGIVVMMYTTLENYPAHIRAKYAEDEVIVSLDGTVPKGGLPEKKMRQLLVWMDLHYDELIGNWTLIQNGQPHVKIKPLT